jgi:hypothetical protein
MRGPGPGCLGPERERPRGGARGDAGWALAGRARAGMSPFSSWAVAHSEGLAGLAGLVSDTNSASFFIFFQRYFSIEFT